HQLDLHVADAERGGLHPVGTGHPAVGDLQAEDLLVEPDRGLQVLDSQPQVGDAAQHHSATENRRVTWLSVVRLPSSPPILSCPLSILATTWRPLASK